MAGQPSGRRLAAGGTPNRWRQLPAHGARVTAVGCGTSYHMAGYAALRGDASHGVSDALPASEMPLGRSYDAVVLVNCPRATTEIPGLVPRLAAVPRTVMSTAGTQTPVDNLVRDDITFQFAEGPLRSGALGPHSAVCSLGITSEGLADEEPASGATRGRAACDPMVALTVVQCLAGGNARGRGLDPDHPRLLTPIGDCTSRVRSPLKEE